MRITLVTALESRDGTTAKDEKLQNLMVDPLAPEKVMKRPGMWQTNLYNPTGQAFGIFAPDGEEPVYIFGDPLAPVVGSVDPLLMGFVVTNVETDADPQYQIATISPYSPFTTGYTLVSPSGFPLLKNYVVRL